MMSLLMTACVKDPEPSLPLRFSVLGDSYSTFEGYVHPDSNDVWYCLPPDNFIDVTSVEQMWWYKVANEMDGWVLDKNNSFSGSLYAISGVTILDLTIALIPSSVAWTISAIPT